MRLLRVDRILRSGLLPPFPGSSPGADRTLSDATRQFALGTRSLADVIAPAAVEVGRDHVRLDAHYARTLVVTGYPRTVSPGWLSPLIDFEEPLELSMHIEPLPSGEMIAALTHKLVQLHSSRLLHARGGRLEDPEREVAYEDAARLRDAVQRGDQKVFSVGLALLLRAATLRALDDLTRRVEATLDGMLAQSRVAVLEQDLGWQTCLPQGLNLLGTCRNLDTSSLATTFPFSSGTLTMDRGVLYGIATHNHSPVIVDPFDPTLENANAAVFATSGAGKSYFTKLMALRNLLTGVDFLVIDPEDEYRRLADAVGGQVVRLAATSAQHLNPFDLPPAETDEAGQDAPDPLAEHVAALQGLFALMLGEPGKPLAHEERAVLEDVLYAVYTQAGITPDVTTHHRPAPLLAQVQAHLDRWRTPRGESLALRLRRYTTGSLSGLFAGPTNVALDQRFVVFNLQALAPELRPLGIHLIASFVWNQVRRSHRPRLLIIDEAWSLLREPEGGAFLASMARRARKYHLGLVTITQDVADFLGSEHGRTVLANAAIKLLLKQDRTTIEPVVAALRLSSEERQFLLAAGKGEGLFFARGSHVALQVEASPAEHLLATTAPRERYQPASPAASTEPTTGIPGWLRDRPRSVRGHSTRIGDQD